jgi:hypothetical protein
VTTQPTTWPDGVIARYLTVAGVALADKAITVDVIRGGFEAVCRGCGDEWGNSYAFTVTNWAQSHAESCRAMPCPTA